MGKSSKGTKGYKYFTSLVLMLGNRIECLLGVNFDKKGWVKPNNLKTNIFAGSHLFDYPELYGDTEGGISGFLALYDGDITQAPDSHYQQYFPFAPAYRHQSYVVLRDFYVGNSPYLKDVMFLPKRTQIRNDGSEQWYRVREDGAVVCEIGEHKILTSKIYSLDIPNFLYSFRGLPISKHYSHSEGIFGNTASSAYGGVEDENISATMFLQPVADELSLFDLVKIEARAVGIVRELEFKLVNVDQYYDLKIEKIGGLNDEKELNISFVCRKTNAFPYVEFFGKGTILIHGSHKYFWQISSRTTALDSYGFTDSQNGVDINPIHKAREIITDYAALGKPESDINDANFRAVASRIWDEGLGISWAIQEKSCKEALQELEAHIEGGFRINRQTGLYECILFRDDFLDLDSALHFDESNIKTVEFDTINADDAINSYNVSYYDREKLKDSTFSIDDVGLIHTVGHVNAEKLDFPYFMNRRNAEIVANWKLKQASTAAWKGSFTTGRYDARKINKYDVILLSWQSKQLVKIPVRVLNISLGDGSDNTVTIDFIEIVSYSENMNATINSDESMNKVLEPQQNNAVVFEAPYYELVQENGQANVNLELENNAEAGYLMTAVSKPQNNSIYALLYTDKATQDYEKMEKVGYVDYCPSLTLDQDISFTDSVFSVRNATEISLAKVGTLILLNDELLVYQSYDITTSKLTVKRGARDTVPKPHLKDAVFYFFDEFRFIDTEQYVAGEIVQAQVLTTTPSAVQKREQIDVKTLELSARAIRPYPPANVKINDEYYPTEIKSDLVLTWVNRNRLQQTGGNILGYFDGGVTIENGTTYYLKVVGLSMTNEETVLVDKNIGSVNKFTIPSSSHVSYSIELSSQRDGYSSLQKFKHTVSTKLTAPENLVATFIL